eukprot:s1093_g9.t1
MKAMEAMEAMPATRPTSNESRYAVLLNATLPSVLQATASFSAGTGSAQSRGLDCLKRNPWKRAWCTLVISAKQCGKLKSISFQSKSGGTKQVWAPARHFR